MPSASTHLPKTQRDGLLDFWRGLCLVDMVLVHLVTFGLSFGPLADRIISQYFRFAAGGFILVSGVSIGTLYLPKARANLATTSWRLLRRALLILVAHYLVEIAFLVRWSADGVTGRQWLNNFLGACWHVVTLEYGSDLLLFYSMMLAVTPLILAMLRRGWWKAVLGLSLMLVLATSSDPHRFAFPLQNVFFPTLWQLIFVAGILLGAARPMYESLPPEIKRTAALGVTAHALTLTILASGASLSSTLPMMPAHWFEKVPLSFAEALRYMTLTAALCMWSELLWARVSRVPAAYALRLLGSQSLAMYLVHIWFAGAMLRVCNAWNAAFPTKLLLFMLCLGGMLLVARMIMTWKQFVQNQARGLAAKLALQAATVVAVLAVLPVFNQAVWPEPLTQLTQSTEGGAGDERIGDQPFPGGEFDLDHSPLEPMVDQDEV
jgi:hypothetical protein